MKKSKNIKNVQIKVEPGPYITTNVTVVDNDEPCAKKRRMEAPVSATTTFATSVPDAVQQQQQAALLQQMQQQQFLDLTTSYLEAFNIKQEMESPMTMFPAMASVDSVLTPTLLETPKLEQPTTQFTYTELPDIEDLTVGLCMNSSCGANFNHHCMINELDISPNFGGLSTLFNTTPTLQQHQAPFIIMSTPLVEANTPFAFDELSDLLGNSTGNLISTGSRSSSIVVQSGEEDFLLS
jgi:hypothetical protein